MSDAGTKETNDCKLFWGNGEDVHVFEVLGNPAEASDEELLLWAANETNQSQHKRFVASIARLTDNVLRESYVDGRFLVELKKRMIPFSANNHPYQSKKKTLVAKTCFVPILCVLVCSR